jgi:hypothetical protein
VATRGRVITAKTVNESGIHFIVNMVHVQRDREIEGEGETERLGTVAVDRDVETRPWKVYINYNIN